MCDLCPIGALKGADANAQQPKLLVQGHPPQAFSGRAPDLGRIRHRVRQREITRHGLEVVVAQLDADRAANVAFALEILRHARAQAREYLRERLAVLARMEVPLEGRFAADGLGFGTRDDGPVIDAVRGIMEPGAITAPEITLQKIRVGRSQLGNRRNAEAGELLGSLWPDAVDLAHGQRPDARLDILDAQQGDAIRLLEVGADFRQELVRRDADRAGEAGGFPDGLLDPSCQVRRAAGHVSQVDKDFVDAAVLYFRRDGGDGRLEQAGIVPVGIEIDGQQDGVGRELRGFHQSHAREDAKRPGFIGGGGDDAAPLVIPQAGEDTIAFGVGGGLQGLPSADDDGLPAQFRVLQQLDGGIEGIHVEVGDAARGWGIHTGKTIER